MTGMEKGGKRRQGGFETYSADGRRRNGIERNGGEGWSQMTRNNERGELERRSWREKGGRMRNRRKRRSRKE